MLEAEGVIDFLVEDLRVALRNVHACTVSQRSDPATALDKRLTKPLRGLKKCQRLRGGWGGGGRYEKWSNVVLEQRRVLAVRRTWRNKARVVWCEECVRERWGDWQDSSGDTSNYTAEEPPPSSTIPDSSKARTKDGRHVVLLLACGCTIRRTYRAEVAEDHPRAVADLKHAPNSANTQDQRHHIGRPYCFTMRMVNTTEAMRIRLRQ